MVRRMWVLLVVVMLAGSGCSFRPLVLTPKVAAPDGGHSPAVGHASSPTVLLDGRDTRISADATISLSVCKDNPSPGVRKVVGWQGQGAGAYIAEVSFFEIDNQDQKNTFINLTLPNGDEYNNGLKTTHINIQGPVDGVYKISGTVHRDSQGADDFLKTVTIDTTVECANYNYGELAGCKYATAEEIAAAAGLPLKIADDRGLRGCQYGNTENLDFARLEYFPTSSWDEYLESKNRDGEVEEVPELGPQAKIVGNTTYYKTSAQRSFGIFVQDTRPIRVGDYSDHISKSDAEIAIARIVAPRIEADTN